MFISGLGEVWIVDWSQGLILARKEYAMPQGVCIDDELNLLLIGQRRANSIARLLSPGNPLSTKLAGDISHPILANVHSIEKRKVRFFRILFSFFFRVFFFFLIIS